MTSDLEIDSRAAKVVDWSMRILVISSVLVGGWLAQSFHNNFKCQSDVNDRLINRTKNLTAITDQERTSLRRIELAGGDLWDAVAANATKPGSVSPADIQARFTDYRSAIADYRVISLKADQERAKNPPVELPSNHC